MAVADPGPAPVLASTANLAALRRGDLAGARALSLAGLGLEALPEEVGGLAGSLEMLDLAGNRLRDLPPWLAQFSQLRVVFGSANPFTVLPEVLGSCPNLSQIGFRGCDLRTLPAAALPPGLRWLTVTDNRIASLPDALGACVGLRKLLLAGNRLAALPESLACAPALELIRVSANQFETLPAWLPALPRLAWSAWAGNPVDSAAPERPARHVDWATLSLGTRLGSGSSGEVWRATLQDGSALAIKLFKGTVSSDGLAAREIDAALAAGDHPSLIGGLAEIAGHPEARAGLALPLLSDGWRPLADPPDATSCTRDVYAAEQTFTLEQVRTIATAIAEAVAHLHATGFAHGDLYAHNIMWDGTAGHARLGDLGAASRLPSPLWAAADTRAWAILFEELLDRCPQAWPEARDLIADCTHQDPARTPSMHHVVRRGLGRR